jgi:hypothetical protein
MPQQQTEQAFGYTRGSGVTYVDAFIPLKMINGK